MDSVVFSSHCSVLNAVTTPGLGGDSPFGTNEGLNVERQPPAGKRKG